MSLETLIACIGFGGVCLKIAYDVGRIHHSLEAALKRLTQNQQQDRSQLQRHAQQLQRHSKQLANHEPRIERLESRAHPTP